MKTIEEKARAYDEAAEGIQEILSSGQEFIKMSRLKLRLQPFFPELKESEEWIRNELISLVRLDGWYPMEWTQEKKNKMITWLERQGEQKPNPYSGTSFEYNGHTWGMCARDNGVDILFNKKLIQHISSEKQAEQKSIDYNEELKKCRKNPLYFFDKYVKREERKSADKVESKFHEGDWVANDYCVGKVIALTDDAYLLDSGQGIPFSCEHNAHLWTIQDAKDGDVLFAENFDNIGGCVFLFKGLDSWKFDAEGDRAVATGYCCASITESGNTDFGIQGPDCVEIKRVHPATKEQRDFLFQKMIECGYTWNAEKKELLEIKEELTDFEKSLKHIMIETLECGDTHNLKADAEMLLRIANKHKEWNEEDEKTLNSILNDLSQDVIPDDEDIQWLKSLKQRYTWKPSNEQMEVLLSEVTAWKKGCPKQIVLESLYNDLKELKGE